jgi:hypothetical protein
MARVYNGFSSYRPFAGGYQGATGLYARLVVAASRRWERLWLTIPSEHRESEDRWSRQSVSEHLPGSLFDARYNGLTADAAGIDAAIMRCAGYRPKPQLLLMGVEVDHPCSR